MSLRSAVISDLEVLELLNLMMLDLKGLTSLVMHQHARSLVLRIPAKLTCSQTGWGGCVGGDPGMEALQQMTSVVSSLRKTYIPEVSVQFQE